MADVPGDGIPAELRAAVRNWIDADVDPGAQAELRALLDAGDAAALADRFAAPLAFGTAGLRGPLRAGPNGMNRAVVRRTAAGLARWLTDHGKAGGVVVIGFDARHGSHDFAADSAAVLSAAGFDARLMPRVLPTPVLAYAALRLGAAAGVMVTASHNPPQDNGYKVYAGDGAQIIPPADTRIEAAIGSVGAARDIPLRDDYTVLDDTVVEDYVRDIAALAEPGPRNLRVVHTALHGVGTELIGRVFAATGFAPPVPVRAQADPDPDFPTVAFPNPEEPGALDLSIETARACGADLIVANDPDADRCSVAVPTPGGGWRQLSGDQVGVLLADRLLQRGVRGTYATTIVSSSMLRAMTERAGVGYAETLTGFKWISRAADDLVYGYEEALGYAVAPRLVRDKDGVSAALVICDYAALLKQRGSDLGARLDELAAEYDRYATDQLSFRVEDRSQIAAAMARLRSRPPGTLLDRAVSVDDLQPEADVVRLSWPGGRVVVRPSGTEPKLKTYLEVVVPESPEAAGLARAALDRLRGEVTASLGL